MKSSVLKSVEKPNKKPILIVDKIGVIGEALAKEFSKDYITFLVSKRRILRKNKNIVLVPFLGKIPKAPENLYSKTFIIDDGEDVTRESVFSFIEASRKTDSSLYFLSSIRNLKIKYVDEIIKRHPKVKVLIFGDLFDNEILFDKNSSITKFIIEARKNNKIKVPGVGLSLNYPISLSDTVKLIVRATYLEIPEKAILLFSKYPITDISLANTFQKIDPNIDVDFEKEKNEEKISIPKNSQNALEKYDLKNKLSEIDLSLDKSTEEASSREKNDFNFLKPIFFFLIACAFLMLLPLLTTYGYSKVAELQIKSSVDLSEKGEFGRALKKSQNAEKLYGFAGQTADALSYQAKFFGKEEKAFEISKRSEAGENLSKANTLLLEGVISLNKLNQENALEGRREIDNALASFKNAYIILQGLRLSNEIPEYLKEKYERIFPVVETISETSEVIPKILGFDKEKKYLIVFTNNSEIRPGGGVVEGVAEVNIRNGRIKEFRIIYSSEINEKITSNIEPPFALRRHSNKESFEIGDSLFDPNFPTGAAATATIFKLAENKDVDGVISVSPEFFKQILSGTEMVRVSKTNKVISAENIDDLTEDAANGEYLKLIESLVNDDTFKSKVSYLVLSEAVGKSIPEKEILFAFRDEEIQNLFSARNLSGEIIDQRSEDEKSVNDYFGVIESSLENNASNYFVSKSISRRVMVDENGQLVSSAIIYFKNIKEEKGGVGYKNYIRIILPEGSRIQSISDGNKNTGLTPAITDPAIYERNNFIPPSEAEIEETSESNKSIFGFLISVPAGTTKKVSIEYTLPFRLNDEKTKYSVIVYKQPGIKEYSYSQTFNLQESYKILPENKISTAVDKDKEFVYQIFKN